MLLSLLPLVSSESANTPLVVMLISSLSEGAVVGLFITRGGRFSTAPGCSWLVVVGRLLMPEDFDNTCGRLISSATFGRRIGSGSKVVIFLGVGLRTRLSVVWSCDSDALPCNRISDMFLLPSNEGGTEGKVFLDSLLSSLMSSNPLSGVIIFRLYCFLKFNFTLVLNGMSA